MFSIQSLYGRSVFRLNTLSALKSKPNRQLKASYHIHLTAKVDAILDYSACKNSQAQLYATFAAAY